MANTTALEIEFNSVPQTGDTISFTIGTQTITHLYVLDRSASGQVTIADTIEQSAINYQQAVLADTNTVTANILGNKVILAKAPSYNFNFTDASYTGKALVSFFFFNPSQDIFITGLYECMYINNDILITLNSTGDRGYFIIRLTNLSNGNISTNNITAHQGIDGLATINLSPLLKGLFKAPKHTLSILENDYQHGSDLIKIDVSHSSGGVQRSIRKHFVRGGIKTNKTNIIALQGSILHPTEKIPVWIGYPIGVSYLENDGVIYYAKTAQYIDDVYRLDFRRVTGCNNILVKFLNQMGGYSFWLFDTYGKTNSNKNKGSYIEYNNLPYDLQPSLNTDYTDIGDLGNDSDTKIYCSAKFPSNYLPIFEDLIISPEVYIYDNVNGYTRVTCGNNSLTEEPNKRAYNLKINFDFNYRFNPSLLWSN